jgi:hypothetical protein
LGYLFNFQKDAESNQSPQRRKFAQSGHSSGVLPKPNIYLSFLSGDAQECDLQLSGGLSQPENPPNPSETG